MIVLDASAAVDLLLDSPPFAERIAREILSYDGDLHAPHLLDAEVGQALRRFVLRRSLKPARAELALARMAQLPLTRYPHGPLLRRAFAMRSNLTVYDGLYVALAEALRAPLLTRDGELAAAARRRTGVLLIS